jgi:YVTN family beta-propeller protein
MIAAAVAAAICPAATSQAADPSAAAAPASLHNVATVKAHEPLGVVADPHTADVYVTDTASNSLSVFSTTNDHVLATVPVGKAPRQLTVDDGRGYVYVPNFYSNTLSVVRSTGKFGLVATVKAGPNPDSVAVDPANGHLYVTDSNKGASHGKLKVINPKTWHVMDTVRVGTFPSGIAYDPDNGDFYVSNQHAGSVTVVRATNDHVVATLDLPKGATPHGITVDTGSNTVYVADGGANSITAINDANNKVKFSASAGKGAHHIVDDPSQGVFVTDWGSGKVTQLSSLGLRLASDKVCGQPDGISYDAADSRMYVACAKSNEVVVLKTGL